MIRRLLARLLPGASKVARKPRVYGPTDHPVRRDQLSGGANQVIRRLQDAGFKAFVVGGAVRDLLQRVLPGVNLDAVPVHGVPSAARWRAPLQHRRLAAGSDADVFVARSGWLVRRTVVVPHARAQSVRVTQGPWQRRLRLATVHLDSTPGRITPMAAHRDALDARALAEEQLVLARAARRSFRPEHWMTQPPDRGGPPR